MSSEKLWLDLSDRQVERSKISKFLEDARDIGSRSKIKSRDFTAVSIYSSQPNNELMGFDDRPEKGLYLNREGRSDPDSPIWNREVPTAPSPKPNYVELQQSYWRILMDLDDIPEKSFYLNPKGRSDQGIPTAISSKPNYVELQQGYMGILNEVKQEVEQARLLDNDIEEIKNEAYDDSDIVMKALYDAGVSIPEVDWNEDGSINLSWFLKTGGTSTILLYGDDHVIYNAYLGPDNYVRSVCKIRDRLVLPKLIGILLDITK